MNNGAGANFTPWTLIGTNTKPFTGTFDGNNKTISGLYINVTTDYVGLFGYIGTNGTVQNVTLADSYVSGSYYVGGICGQNNGGTVQNCHNTGKVSGSWYVGGVCGSNTGSSTIQECYNTGKVSGNNYVGGVCGQNNRATVEKSYNTNTVSGGGRVGGVCGENSGTVNGCYNTGKVSGKGFNVGGVCGYNSNTLENSFNTGDVSGDNNVGGVCGQNGWTVKGCYNIGTVSSTSGSSGVGSVCGDGMSPSACYYLDTTAPSAGSGTPKTEAVFKNGEVAHLLQSLLGGADVAQVWGQRIGTDPYPVLSSDPAYTVYPKNQYSPCKAEYSNTSGILYHDYNTTDGVCKRCGAWQEAEPDNNDYYEITNQGQLRWFADQVNNQNRPNINARLMNDITMDGTKWTPIGTSDEHPFTGDFNGSGKTISKLTCTDAGADYVGLVGYAVGATIQNVTVQDSSFNGHIYIGAVCGYI